MLTHRSEFSANEDNSSDLAVRGESRTYIDDGLAVGERTPNSACSLVKPTVNGYRVDVIFPSSAIDRRVFEYIRATAMDKLTPEVLQLFESFKSPASALLGTRLIAFDCRTRSARISFDVAPEFLNILGGVHGGFIAAMLDEAAGMGARLSLNPATVLPSLDFRVSFLAPAPASRLFAETRCLQIGRRVAFLEADLLHNDRLLARMNVTSIVVEGSAAPGPGPS